MSENRRQIVLVSAVSILIALSIGAGVYYSQPKSSNSESVRTVTNNPAFTFIGGTPINSSCNKYVLSKNPTSAHNTSQTWTSIGSMWRYTPESDNLTDLQVAAFELSPGVSGHICVAYPIAAFKVVG